MTSADAVESIVMPTTLAPPAIEATQRFVLHDVSWEQYIQIADGLGERNGTRATYDGASLELMTTSHQHERIKELLGNLFRMFSVEMAIPTVGGGSMTFRRSDLERGLEPDECYWITNEERMRVAREPDFRVDPPPDLCIEIEVSRTVVDRLSIYAALGVPEVWRCDGRSLTVLRLTEGTYTEADESVEVPGFPVAEIPRFLDLGEPLDDTTRLRNFVTWLRDRGEELSHDN